MAVKVDWDDSGIRRSSNDRYSDMDFDEFWLRFQPGSGRRGNEYLIRFLGDPIKFATHYNNMTDPQTGDRTRKEFPDADSVRKIKRNCTDGEVTLQGETSTKCPWCKLGYRVTERYMVNLAYYGNLDDDGDPTIMLAEMPKSAWDDVAEWYMVNRDSYDDCRPGTLTGVAPKFLIRVKSRGQGPIEYKVTAQGQPEPLPDDIKRALKKFNPEATTKEEVMELHDLERWCKPTYMSGDLQKDLFGEIVDEVPYQERDNDDIDNYDDDDEDDTDPFGTNDAEDDSGDDASADDSDFFNFGDDSVDDTEDDDLDIADVSIDDDSDDIDEDEEEEEDPLGW